MSAKRGGTLLVKRSNGDSPETFTTVGAIRNASLSINGSPIDVTTVDDVDGNNEIWRTSITGLKDLSISGDGIGKAIEPIQSFYEDFAAGTLTNYQIVVPYVGTWEASMIITEMTFEGPYDGVLSFSFGMAAASAPTFTAET